MWGSLRLNTFTTIPKLNAIQGLNNSLVRQLLCCFHTFRIFSNFLKNFNAFELILSELKLKILLKNEFNFRGFTGFLMNIEENFKTCHEFHEID